MGRHTHGIKFIQIATMVTRSSDDNVLYALDSSGNIWYSINGCSFQYFANADELDITPQTIKEPDEQA